MQKRGTGLDVLYETLKQFNTKSKSILPAGNSKAVVTFNFRGHDYMGWNIACTGEENPIHKLNGKRYDRFLIALKALYKTTTLFEIRNNDSVLCYRDTEPERDNGKIVSHWFDLSPAFPYVIGMDGQPKFKVLRLALNDWEYSRMMETRMAFSHNGIYYPLLKTSLHSVGSRLDCSAAFKQLDACPLGGALLLAEKFAQVNALVVQYRDSTERVRPVLSVSGRDFVHVPLTEYFQKAIANIPGIYDMVKWEVTDDGALADFRLVGSGDDTFIRIEGGDLPGKTMRVSACVRLAGAVIPLKTNKLAHIGTVTDDMYHALFNGIMESVSNYMLSRSRHYISGCPDLSAVRKAIGKKRYRALHLSELETAKGDNWELVETVIRKTNGTVRGRQREILQAAYTELVREAGKEA